MSGRLPYFRLCRKANHKNEPATLPVYVRLALGKARQADLQELHSLACRGDRLLAFVQMDRRVFAKSLSGDGTGAGSYKVNRMTGETQVGARRDAIKRNSGTQVRKFPEMLVVRPGWSASGTQSKLSGSMKTGWR